MSFTPLGDSLNKKMKDEPTLQTQLEADEAVTIANAVFVELFGEDMALAAKPLFLKNRTLTVSCSSTAMANEIRLNQAKIVTALNKKMGKNEVDRIRYLA